MKINKLEAHDRLQYLKQDQSLNVFKGAEDCLKRNPLSLSFQDKCPYVYLFAHPRTMDDGVTKAMYWQPRLTRPKPQSNSYLFRAKSKTDLIEVCWLIPPRELWEQYGKGKVTSNDLVAWSIDAFRFSRINLEKDHPEDWTEERLKPVLKQIVDEHKQNLKQKTLIMPKTSVENSL